MSYKKLIECLPNIDIEKDDYFIYSTPPHSPTETIIYKIDKKDIELIVCGVEVEDIEPSIRKKVKKCLI